MHNPTSRPAAPHHTPQLARFAFPYMLAAALSACGEVEGGGPPRGLLDELSREVGSTPTLAPRLSIESGRLRLGRRWTPAAPGANSFLPVGSATAERISRIGARARRAGGGPEAMHAEALVDLLGSSGAGKRLDASISSLQNVARLTERPAPALADLAAALLVRAERAGTPRDLLAAIEAAEEALEHEPGNRAALFNRALALQRWGLVEEAAHDWRAYLRVDSTSGWASEARVELRDTADDDGTPAVPAADAPDSAFAAFAAADPQGARILGWCRVLEAWGAAAQARLAEQAEAHLRRADALGSTLEQRPGGDVTLADAVRAIRAAGHGAARLELARAHQEFAAGCTIEARAEFRDATPRFAAAASAEGSPALRGWAQVMYGGTLYHSGRSPDAEKILRKVAGSADPSRYPALVGYARQLLAMVSLRGDRYDTMLEEARQGHELFVRAGERQNDGVLLDALSNARFSRREVDEGYLLAHQSLLRLRPYRSSYRLHNQLRFTARTAGADGFPRAAIRVQDEGVRVAERTGNPVYVAEARLTRAQLLAALGALPRAAADVAVAKEAMLKIMDPRVHGWMVTQRQLAEAAPLLGEHPERVARALDSAAAFFRGMHAPRLALPAVVASADAWLVAGDPARGTARLEAALAILEQRRDSIRMEPRRAAVFEAAREVVDRVVMLELAAGRTGEALASLDQGRASLASVGSARAPGADRVVSGPPGEVVLVYALVGDTLLAWTVSGRRVELFRTVVDTARLVHVITGVRWQLETAGREAELRSGLARLYEWLVRPLEGRLGGAETPLVVVTDGELASVPFAALYDARRRRYLVEDRALRFAPSLQEARRPPHRAAGAEAVFVADPAFDRTEHAGFERLTGALPEVREIVSGYPRARVLAERAAHPDALRAAFERAGMVHYAGHAVFDDERPERSYLLLASTPGKPGRSRLEAGEIAQLDLRHLSVVVLAACQTVRTGPGRAAGFSGLAGAFLAAGAGGAVGSLWEVDDRSTRRLMVEFHRAYRASGNAPAALRAAQLRLLRSGDGTLRSPAAWAGFRYTGD